MRRNELDPEPAAPLLELDDEPEQAPLAPASLAFDAEEEPRRSYHRPKSEGVRKSWRPPDYWVTNSRRL